MTVKKANAVRGEVDITLTGKQFVMRPTATAILGFEAELGLGTVALAQRVAAANLGLLELSVIVAHCLRASGEPAPLDRVSEMVLDTGMVSVMTEVGPMLADVLRGGAEEDAQGKKKGAPAALAKA